MTRRRRTIRSGRPDRPRTRALALVPPLDSVLVDVTRVAQAKRRIAAGWYDRSDVRDSLVEAVLPMFRGR